MATFNILEKELQCNICFEVFNGRQNKPLTLNCGHSSCFSCVNSLIKYKNPKCGTCRTEITYEDVRLIPINYSLKNLAATVEFEELKEVCEVHNSVRNCECLTHQRMICGVCGMVDHKGCDTKYIGITLTRKKQEFREFMFEKRSKLLEIFSNIVSSIHIKQENVNNFKRELEEKVRCLPEVQTKYEEAKFDLEEINKKFDRIKEIFKNITILNEELKSTTIDSIFEKKMRSLKGHLSRLQIVGRIRPRRQIESINSDFAEEPPCKRTKCFS